MAELEYVARVDGLLGPRGCVVSKADWSKLDESAREDFSPREVREDEGDAEVKSLPAPAAKEK